MKQRRTSLKDLAQQLGVSIATVSRALRNSHEVGDDMKRRIQALAKEMNYRPNPFAQRDGGRHPPKDYEFLRLT